MILPFTAVAVYVVVEGYRFQRRVKERHKSKDFGMCNVIIFSFAIGKLLFSALSLW